MAEPTYTVKALDESTWDAFAPLVERNNGVFDGCWCMGFHPEGVGKGTTPAGALSTYEKLGFARDRKIGKHRWVMTRVVEPRS
jgi:hypothetical protein